MLRGPCSGSPYLHKEWKDSPCGSSKETTSAIPGLQSLYKYGMMSTLLIKGLFIIQSPNLQDLFASSLAKILTW